MTLLRFNVLVIDKSHSRKILYRKHSVQIWIILLIRITRAVRIGFILSHTAILRPYYMHEIVCNNNSLLSSDLSVEFRLKQLLL